MDYSSYFNAYITTTIRIGTLLVALPALSYISHFIKKTFAQRFSQHIGVLTGHVIFYGGTILIGVTLLHEFGFNVTALLGAAGVIGIAVGFAAQTSIANIISGFFLLLERPFSLGDMIKSGDTIGIAESIDLLAVRVKTRDNRLIRIPNEMVLKHSLINLTYYPTRRIDLLMSVPHTVTTDNVIQTTQSVIARNKTILKQPVPSVFISTIGQLDYDTEIRTFFSIRAWVATEDFYSAPAQLITELKDTFDTLNNTITVNHTNQ